MRILLVGVSTRALAESALRAGLDVVAADYFGDLDQSSPDTFFGRRAGLRPSLRKLPYARFARFLTTTVSSTREEPIKPALIDLISKDKVLFGNDSKVLRGERPHIVARGLQAG